MEPDTTPPRNTQEATLTDASQDWNKGYDVGRTKGFEVGMAASNKPAYDAGFAHGSEAAHRRAEMIERMGPPDPIGQKWADRVVEGRVDPDGPQPIDYRPGMDSVERYGLAGPAELWPLWQSAFVDMSGECLSNYIELDRRAYGIYYPEFSDDVPEEDAGTSQEAQQ